MRTALFLLLLRVVAAIPVSLIPQRTSEAIAVNQYVQNNPGLSQWYERLGPVSYTHLDVYKRQARKAVSRFWPIRTNRQAPASSGSTGWRKGRLPARPPPTPSPN